MKRIIGMMACLLCMVLAGCAAFPSQMAARESDHETLTAYALRDLKEDIARDGVPTEKQISEEDARLQREFWEAYADDRAEVAAGKMSEQQFFYSAKDSYENTWKSEVQKLRDRRKSVLDELELRARASEVDSASWDAATQKAASARLDLSDLNAE